MLHLGEQALRFIPLAVHHLQSSTARFACRAWDAFVHCSSFFQRRRQTADTADTADAVNSTLAPKDAEMWGNFVLLKCITRISQLAS